MVGLLRRLFARPTPMRRAPVRLSLESLEDRRLPSTIATAGNALYVIRSDHSVWTKQGTGNWFALTGPGFAASVSATAETTSGQSVLFALTTDGWVYKYVLGQPWQRLGGFFTAVSAGTDATGNAEVFAQTANGQLYEFSTTSVAHVGDFLLSMSAAGNGSVYVVLTNHSVFKHTPQGWTSIAPANTAVAFEAVTQGSGAQVYYALTPNGFVQTSQNGGPWTFLIGAAKAMDAGTDANGNATLFALTGQVGPQGQTSLFEFPSQSASISLGNWVSSLAASSHDTVFVTLTDGSVYEHTSGGWISLAPAGYALD